VHALRHAHELLITDGTLVDLHPVTEQVVETGGRVLGTILEPDWTARILPNAEARLRDAIRHGLFVLEDEIEYDLCQHFDTAQDLLEAKSEVLGDQAALAASIRAADAPLLTRERYVGRRLRVRRTRTTT
jgi:hypothetical protein